MAWTVQQKTVKDGLGGSFPLDILGDGTNFIELGVVYDPLTGAWAQVDASGRLKVLSQIADGVTPSQIAAVDAAKRLAVLADLHDPVSGLIVSVDANNRLKVSAAPAQEVSVSGSQYALAVGISAVVTLTVPAGATHAWITCDPDGTANRLRYTKDGSTTPTQAVGHTMELGDSDLYSNLSQLKFIAEGTVGQTVSIQVSYVHF